MPRRPPRSTLLSYTTLFRSRRLRGDVAEHGGGRGRHERLVVVLARGEDVEPDLLGLLGDRHHRLDPRLLGWHPPVRRVRRDVADSEDPELHDCSLSFRSRPKDPGLPRTTPLPRQLFRSQALSGMSQVTVAATGPGRSAAPIPPARCALAGTGSAPRRRSRCRRPGMPCSAPTRPPRAGWWAEAWSAEASWAGSAGRPGCRSRPATRRGRTPGCANPARSGTRTRSARSSAP